MPTETVTHATTTAHESTAAPVALATNAIPAVPGGPGTERHLTTSDVPPAPEPTTETTRTETSTEHVPAKDVEVKETTTTKE